jgi:NAD(P)-dependent dehydrogenase (short-subunit alcohol dehydrogenase family)
MAKKNILVTGGLGAVGSYLVKALRARGNDVFVCDMSHHYESNYARCDVGEFRQVERLWTGGGWEPGYAPKARRFDLVYHLAAEFGRWNGEDYYEKVWRTNAVGTKNLLRMQEPEGHVFRSDSDNEVLLHAYARYGAAMVDKLRGMFAFALFDAAKGALLLARDPYGIKPLYYADNGEHVRFASQVRAARVGCAK